MESIAKVLIEGHFFLNKDGMMSGMYISTYSEISISEQFLRFLMVFVKVSKTFKFWTFLFMSFAKVWQYLTLSSKISVIFKLSRRLMKRNHNFLPFLAFKPIKIAIWNCISIMCVVIHDYRVIFVGKNINKIYLKTAEKFPKFSINLGTVSIFYRNIHPCKTNIVIISKPFFSSSGTNS